MKQLKKYNIVACVTIMVAFMFLSKTENKEILSLKNVKMLQVSAGEAECKDTSNNPCEIQIPNGPIIKGVGQPWAQW